MNRDKLRAAMLDVLNRHEWTGNEAAVDALLPICLRADGARPAGAQEQPRVSVEGTYMDRSLANFERACLVTLDTEQSKPSPDTALIALICDAVRLKRELSLRADYVPPAAHSPTGAPTPPREPPAFEAGEDGERRHAADESYRAGDYPPLLAFPESGWVIERHVMSELRYWTGNGTRECDFWPEHERAIRFARKEDADTALSWLIGGIGRTAEHKWTAASLRDATTRTT